MPDMPTEKRALLDTIDHLFAQMKAIASAIFSEPELGYQEFKSSARLADFLEANGFAVERGLLDMPTAFHAVNRGSNPLGDARKNILVPIPSRKLFLPR